MARRVLLVGVSLELRDRVAKALPDAAVTAVDELDPSDVQADAIVCDWERTGVACCALVHERDLRIPVIALLDERAEERVVAAMRAGASDVVIVDRLSRLPAAIGRDASVLSRAPSSAMPLSELRFRSLWSSDIVLITVVGSDGNIIDANAAFSQLLGWTCEELRNMSWNMLTPPDWSDTDAAARELLLSTGAARPWEKEVLAKDGRRVPILASQVLIPGKPPQAIAFALDLSEHKRIDRALHERVRIATATADFALALTETPNLEATLQRSCDVICSTFEVQRVELWTVEQDELRLRASSCIADGTSDRTLMTLAEQGLRRSDWPARWPAQLQALDGFERYSVSLGGELVGLIRLVCAEPLGAIAQESIATIANASAIAMQRARAESRKDIVEAELRQAQKLEAIGRLAAGVAHDFNNLLSVIIGYARLARTVLTPADELTSMIAEIEAAGERAKNLTAQLLAFGHRQVWQPRVIDLDRVVLDLRSILQRLLSEAIELEIDRAAGTHLLYADPHQIEQVLMNLIVNSRDAMTGSGRVSVKTDLVTSDSGEKLVKLEVQDNGAGMDETVRARIFEPFFTTKPQGSGTGLGLSTVFGIVKQSGGSIHVDSELGRGTRFQLLFPSVEGPIQASVRPATELVVGGSETILLCEDDRQVRAICRDTLTRYGYHVLEAADAERAIHLSTRADGAIDMLLTDVVMPVMSGRQLAEHIRNTHPDLPVLFMSGYTDDTMLREGVSNEGVQFLQKPIIPEALAGKVRNILDAAVARAVPANRVQ